LSRNTGCGNSVIKVNENPSVIIVTVAIVLIGLN
jgi:hypothetical protein